MKKIIGFLIGVTVMYLVSWAVMYFLLMQTDVTHFFEYFKLSWLGGGEIPTFIQFGSIAITAIAALLYIIVSRKSR
jgi:uncharacterized membrane protein YhdT